MGEVKKINLFFAVIKMRIIFAIRKVGAIAQLVEHRTENPGVPGSIPGGTTLRWPQIPAGLMICGDFFVRVDDFVDEFGDCRNSIPD